MSTWLLLHVHSDSQGIWVPSSGWVSYVDVYVVLVCEHYYDLRSCVRVVVATGVCLVHVIGYVIVLFQSGVFEYIYFCVRVGVATRVCFC